MLQICIHLTVHTIRASAVRASRDEILLQQAATGRRNFRFGHFSPRKHCSESSQSSHVSDSDHISASGNASVEENSCSSDSDNFPVQRWNSPGPLFAGDEQGTDLILDPLIVPSSPSASVTSLISTDYVSSSEAPSESNTESQAPRKKKTSHISADRSLIIESTQQLQDVGGSSSSTSRAVRNRKEVNYARVKHQYTKKQ